MTRLSEKVALVTGGSRGIGAAICKRLAKDGASVALNFSRSEDSAKKVADQIKKEGGKVFMVKGDVSQAEDIPRIISETVSHFERLDILVNNAGIFELSPLDHISLEHYTRQFNVNVMGPLFICKTAFPHLTKNGGRIINVSSIAARAPFSAGAVYCATKASIEAITRCLSSELGPKGITVNAVAPGVTQTDMLDSGMSEEVMEEMIADTALGRLGEPEDIADVVSFLASEDARWVTGQVIDTHGGLRI